MGPMFPSRYLHPSHIFLFLFRSPPLPSLPLPLLLPPSSHPLLSPSSCCMHGLSCFTSPSCARLLLRDSFSCATASQLPQPPASCRVVSCRVVCSPLPTLRVAFPPLLQSLLQSGLAQVFSSERERVEGWEWD